MWVDSGHAEPTFLGTAYVFQVRLRRIGRFFPSTHPRWGLPSEHPALVVRQRGRIEHRRKGRSCSVPCACARTRYRPATTTARDLAGQYGTGVMAMKSVKRRTASRTRVERARARMEPPGRDAERGSGRSPTAVCRLSLHRQPSYTHLLQEAAEFAL